MSMDPQQLLDLINQRRWIPLAALILGLIVRLLKSDTKIPITIPPRLRMPLAIVLGAFVAGIDKLAETTTWTNALLSGGASAAFAILAHNFFIDSLRGGKELPIPGLILENTPPGPGKPPTLPPPALDLPTVNTPISGDNKRTSLLRWPLFAMISIFMVGCALFTREQAPHTILTIKDIACLAEHAFIDDATANGICEMLTAEQRAAANEVRKAQRVAIAKQLVKHPEVCDAGPDATSTRVDVDGGSK